jgi:hypothetical protein
MAIQKYKVSWMVYAKNEQDAWENADNWIKDMINTQGTVSKQMDIECLGDLENDGY